MSAETSGLESIVGASGGRVWYLIIEPLVGGDPVNSFLESWVVEIPESNQAEDHVSGKTRDDLTATASTVFFAS